jgi:hypothetical protein
VVVLGVLAAFITSTSQQAYADSLIGRTANGYEAGKAAAKSGQPDTCPSGAGTLYCIGFHSGYAAANLAQETLK